MTLPLISPEIFSNQIAIAAAAGDFAIDNADVAGHQPQWTRPRRVGNEMPMPSRVML